MSTSLQELHLRSPQPQEDLPLATDGVYRVVWESRFGEMLIEVRDGHACVNGSPVEPVAKGSGSVER